MSRNHKKKPKPKFLLYSLAAHIVIFLLAWSSGILNVNLSSNNAEQNIDPKKKEALRQLKKEELKQRKKRKLSQEHAKLLKKDAERKIRKELTRRLKRMVKVRDLIREEEKEELTKIEQRPTTPKQAQDHNDTSVAQLNNENPQSDALLEQILKTDPSKTDLPDLYNSIREIEKQIADDSRDINAAEYAQENEASYPKAHEILSSEQQSSKSFEEIAQNSQQQETQPGEDSSESPENAEPTENESSTAENQQQNKTGGKPGEKLPTTLEELSQHKDMLEQLSRESQKLESRALSSLEQQGENEDFLSAMNGKKSAPKPSGSKDSEGSGSGTGSGSGNSEESGSMTNRPADSTGSGILDGQTVLAEALPGRRISKSSTRNGWIYVNTWYMIGPWSMAKDFRINRKPFSVPHPPEHGVDFDAVYTDGLVGRGTRETSPKPNALIGTPASLDGTLRWKFMQSESLFNKMPITANQGCYYAYTELYFEEDREMIVAIGTDDRAKVWINNKLIWTEQAEVSNFRIDEYIKKFRFNRGVNKVLVRLNNGGDGALGFSFLLCPPDHLKFKKLKR